VVEAVVDGPPVIQLSAQTKVYCALEAVDFRKGIDGLAQVCAGTLEKDPFGGGVFLFLNRRRTAIKILFYDGQGFWLCLKRLSRGGFRWWAEATPADRKTRELMISEIQVLLWNGNPEGSRVQEMRRKVA
jgi:transposase